MHTTFIKFRDMEDIAIEWKSVEDDPTTNSYEIEWQFADDRIPADDQPTPEEEETIIDHLSQLNAESMFDVFYDEF